MPTDRPILFSGAMVRALLDGRKCQTRRVVKAPRATPPIINPDDFDRFQPEERGHPAAAWFHCGARNKTWVDCPYGTVGDRLWCRETWGELRMGTLEQEGVLCYQTVYRADKDDDWDYREWLLGGGWRPSIHMPRWASRLTLEITGVRVERVQDISEADAIAEGLTCQPDNDGAPMWLTAEGWPTVYPAVAYASLWDSINGKRPGCSWEANPWVWVLEFRRVTNEEATTP